MKHKQLLRYFILYSATCIIFLIASIFDIINNKRAHPIVLLFVYFVIYIIFVVLMAFSCAKKAEIIQIRLTGDKKEIVYKFIEKRTEGRRKKIIGNKAIFTGDTLFSMFLKPIIVIEEDDHTISSYLPKIYAIELKKLLASCQ